MATQTLGSNAAGLEQLTVARALHAAFLSVHPDPPLVIVDEVYRPVDAALVVASIKADTMLARTSYAPNVFDCDDYVVYLRTKLAIWARNNGLSQPLAVGYIITTEHAFNFCIDSDQRVVLINTQSETEHIDTAENPMTFASFLNLSPGNDLRLIYI